MPIKLMRLPISIIIPTFNEEQYLPKLLKSIQRQTVSPYEIIVADNNSIDQTRQIARQFGCKVIDGGLPPPARNNGAKIATQPILLFLDADIILSTNDFLEKTIQEMTDKKLSITSCFMIPLSKSGIDKFIFMFINFFYNLTKRFFPKINGFCIFVRKEIHQKINGFDESLLLGEDYDYVKRAVKVGRFDYLRCCKIAVSIRRLSEEGRIKMALKYTAIVLYIFIFGKIKKNFFNYKFGGHYNK
ncbi:hypothetical protein A3B45_00835 [Candidatus Daviesbacteria bacterium RIFCSPLOWO2_01_FULL_39_12]|uniref:Glycosyltransferase 2-like domain-containing protein n=1 Tax=Candidatus Daviesbacteria bacterium RIFCSPLOWO2_01_FULL_39_12 TaxID=1797785 RepID=A0A1F5KQN4_9BACT|nr:MAG: hypothetical protein A3B45_00835 [Candidatus Daviesbacteria bacterium RIFCSPLOWO2_01_FULL_39_12]